MKPIKLFAALLFCAFALCLVSCGNKVDRAFDKLEVATKEYVKATENGDMEKAEKAGDDVLDALDELEELENEMTDKQKEKYEEVLIESVPITLDIAQKAMEYLYNEF